MLYKGSFSDKNDNIYEVLINTGASTTEVPITLSSVPVTITTSSEGLFAPIKSRSCSIEIVSDTYYMDLYTPTSRANKVRVIKKGDPDTIIFFGYMTPCEYTQTFSNLDTITLETVDALSTAKDFKWSNDGTYKTFLNILIAILSDCGYTGNLYIPQTYTKINGADIDYGEAVRNLYISSANFIDDDAAKTPWNQYDVFAEILRFLGWSAVPYGEDVYLVDYRASAAGAVNYNIYSIITGELLDTESRENVFNVSDYEAAGTPTLSIDDIYNKIEISDNLYKIDSISPDVFDDENHISVTEEKGLGPSGSMWTKTKTSKFLWWETGSTTDITGYDFQTLCRLNPKSGWSHIYHDMRTQEEIPNVDGTEYYDSTLGQKYVGYTKSEGDRNTINKYCNTMGCLLQHYAHVKEEGKNNLPTNLSWTDMLTFFVTNDKIKSTGSFTLTDIPSFELPALEYNITESINWKPSSGKSWITICGDLFYQYNNAKYKDGKTKSTLNIINSDELFYTTAPVDQAVKIDSGAYLGVEREYSSSSSSNYGKGWNVWKMKLKIGDKYWNGNAWTSTESTFYINYNNNPSDRDNEYLPTFKWMSPVNTSTYKDKVGVNGYCIPIDSANYSDPSFGTLTLTVYIPSILPSDLVADFKKRWNIDVGTISWKNLPPVIYCKNFELGYVYTDTGVWYKNNLTSSGNDKVYVGEINDTYVKDFDDIELKINTTLPDQPISRSYVSLRYGYLNTLRHTVSGVDKVQEYNLIDMYLDHYSEKKIIYDCTLHSYFSPDSVFEYSHLGDGFVIDSQSYDVAKDVNTIKLIQF